MSNGLQWVPTLALVPALAMAAEHPSAEWGEAAEVRYRDQAVVTYRARVDSSHVVIEAEHAPGWHSYALDNVERARAWTGKAEPETELPTRIEVVGGLAVDGPWFQSPPEELSQPEIRWFTWGFSGASRFAAKVKRGEGEDSWARINGQACNAELCARIDDLLVRVPVEDAALVDEKTFVAGDLVRAQH